MAKKKKFSKSYVVITLVFLFVLVTCGWITSKYFGFFDSNPPLTREEWGQLGDYFGGTLNPIFGLASFVALLITIFYQAKELKASTKELKNSAIALKKQNRAINLQSFEQTFFSWVSTYRALLGNITEEAGGKSDLGKEALHRIWQIELSSTRVFNMMSGNDPYGRLPNAEFGEYGEEFKNLTHIQKLEILASSHSDLICQKIHSNWAVMYTREKYQLDSFFRTAYKLLTWIDSLDKSRLSISDKWLYISIFRSQLSWIEMIFFFYNGLTEVGEKFKPIIEKYALFDNLDLESDICIKIVQQKSALISRYSAEAFDSDLARKKLGI